jgi:hypothetical protein
MLPLTQQTAAQQLRLRKPRLLIVCDSAKYSAKMRAAFDADAFDITAVASFAELSTALTGHDMIVVKAQPGLLVEMIRTLRAKPGYTALPLLVETSQLTGAELAGLLPLYRAMPCSFSEIVALVKRLSAPAPNRPRAHALL